MYKNNYLYIPHSLAYNHIVRIFIIANQEKYSMTSGYSNFNP